MDLGLLAIEQRELQTEGVERRLRKHWSRPADLGSVHLKHVGRCPWSVAEASSFRTHQYPCETSANAVRVSGALIRRAHEIVNCGTHLVCKDVTS